MEWLPKASAEVTRVATPLFAVAAPNADAPSMKVTVPVGKTGPVPTVAVMVTCWPKTDGFADEAKVVAVVACCTAKVTTLFVVTAGELESETASVNVRVPAVVGVPVMAPVVALNASPAGSAGIVHVYGGTAPMACNVAL